PQQRRDIVGDDLRRIEILRIRPEAHPGAAVARADLAQSPERLLHLAVVGEDDAMPRAVALHLDLEPLRQRIAHADTHAVQTAGDAICRVLVGLAELAARM